MGGIGSTGIGISGRSWSTRRTCIVEEDEDDGVVDVVGAEDTWGGVTTEDGVVVVDGLVVAGEVGGVGVSLDTQIMKSCFQTAYHRIKEAI